MHPYLLPLIEKYGENRNPVYAGRMKQYMKGQFEFYGMPSPVRRSILSVHIRKYGLPQWNDMEVISRNLWEMDERECQFTQLDLMKPLKKNLNPENLPLLEYLISTKSWWDTVDGLAAWFVGELFKRYPELILPTTNRWMQSGNVWLQRSCLLYQLGYKKDTDLELLYNFIGQLSEHKSFWIRKAIGWVLREYSKTDPNIVQDYVSSHPELSGLSKREALKVIIRGGNAA